MSIEQILQKLDEIKALVEKLSQEENIDINNLISKNVDNEIKLEEHLKSHPEIVNQKLIMDTMDKYIDDLCDTETIEIMLKYYNEPLNNPNVYLLIKELFSGGYSNVHQKFEFISDKFNVNVDSELIRFIYVNLGKIEYKEYKNDIAFLLKKIEEDNFLNSIKDIYNDELLEDDFKKVFKELLFENHRDMILKFYINS